MPRPSVHNPITKSYAIDQIEDIEHLRAVAHRMWEAFFACHSQSAHIYGVLTGLDCRDCAETFAGDRETPCARYQEWQKKINAGFGNV